MTDDNEDVLRWRSKDDRVSKHLSPEGIEYRDMRGVVIARLSRAHGQWAVTNVCPEVEHMIDLPVIMYFTSGKAADAFAYVINLERMGAS